MDWEIREWYTELRENDITMHELNMKRASQRRKVKEEQEAKERDRREQQIIERKNELAARQRELEAKELELEEKAALLQIKISFYDDCQPLFILGRLMGRVDVHIRHLRSTSLNYTNK